MLRLSRTRRNDPINEADHISRRFGGRDTPKIDQDFVELEEPLEELQKMLPEHDDRRAMLARDPLASVDGFRVTMHLVYEHLLGMRVCIIMTTFYFYL